MVQRLCADCGQKQDTGDGELHNEGLDTLRPVTEDLMFAAEETGGSPYGV